MSLSPAVEAIRQQMMADRPDLFRVNTKFAPKLTHADRCAVYAYHKLGITVPVLAVAFGINRGTVRHIVTSSSKHYRAVRKEYNEHDEAFMAKYVAPDLSDRIKAAMAEPEVAEPEAVLAEVQRKVAKKRVIRAAGAEGKHRLSHREGKKITTGVLDIMFAKEGDSRLSLGVNYDSDGRPLLEGWIGVWEQSDMDEITIIGSNEHNQTSTSIYKFILSNLVDVEEL